MNQNERDVLASIANREVSVNEASNPANAKDAVQRRPPRIPMSAVRRRLEVYPIPGFYLYWFKEENVPAALAAYYEPVSRHEVTIQVNSPGITGEAGGNTDMGSGVSIIAGHGDGGQPVRLVLMKLPEEYHQEDMKGLEEKNVSIMQAIFGDEAQVGMGGVIQERGDMSYVDQERSKALFNRKIRKARMRRPGRM